MENPSRFGDFAGSADACNLHELCLHGLGHYDDSPQVPLETIVEYVE